MWLPVSSYAQTKNADLIGNYAFSGTETDGKPNAPGTLVISMDKSGALALNWDDGQYVGIGQVAGNVLAVATVAEGREVIMIMNSNLTDLSKVGGGAEPTPEPKASKSGRRSSQSLPVS